MRESQAMMILEMTSKEYAAYLLPSALRDSERLEKSGKNQAYTVRNVRDFATRIRKLENKAEASGFAWEFRSTTELSMLFTFWMRLHASSPMPSGYNGEFMELQWSRLCRLDWKKARAEKKVLDRLAAGA